MPKNDINKVAVDKIPSRIIDIEDYLYEIRKKNKDAEYSYGVRVGNILVIYKKVDKETKEVFVGPMKPLTNGWNDMFYVDFIKSDVRVLIHFFI